MNTTNIVFSLKCFKIDASYFLTHKIILDLNRNRCYNSYRNGCENKSIKNCKSSEFGVRYKWPIELLSQADDGQFSTLISQIQFNAESKFGPYITYLESAKNLSEGKLNKQSANSILDIFKQREEERQKEREEKGKKKKESKTKRALDILDGLLN